MEVRLYATLRSIIGGCRVTLSDDSDTIEELLTELVESFPDLRERLLDDFGIRPHAVVMVDGRDICHLQGLATGLAGADGVDIFPPVAGG